MLMVVHHSMKRTRRATLILFGIACGACGAKQGPSTPSPSPAASTAPTVTAVTIAGSPSILRVGESAPLTATAIFADGSTREVPAVWSTSNPMVGQVTNDPATGRYNLLKGLGAGEAEIAATWVVVGTAHIVVQDAASLQEISGVVHEAGARANLTLPDVRVEISGGAHTGRFVLTDEHGRFDFPDIFDAPLDLWAFRRGYENTRFRVAVLPRDKIADIRIPPTSPTVGQVFDGTLSPDCIRGDTTRSLRFTPHSDGVLVVSEKSINAFESAVIVYRGSTGLNRCCVDGGYAVDLIGGVEHDLRVQGGYCVAPNTGSFHVVFTRPE